MKTITQIEEQLKERKKMLKEYTILVLKSSRPEHLDELAGISKEIGVLEWILEKGQ